MNSCSFLRDALRINYGTFFIFFVRKQAVSPSYNNRAVVDTIKLIIENNFLQYQNTLQSYVRVHN